MGKNLWGLGASPYRVSGLEAREHGEAGMREGENLKQRAHVAGPIAGEAFQSGLDASALIRDRARFQRRGARFDAERSQKVALPHRSKRSRPGYARRPIKFVEIDVDGEVGLARFGKRIDKSVALNRLQPVAERRALVAVIDDERCAALPRDPARQWFRDGEGNLGPF
jgi:hypothetical protein